MTYNIRVPATTANLGAGFDSLGLAFKLYNHLQVSPYDRLLIEIESTTGFMPETDERNLIYRSFCAFYEQTGFSKPSGLHMIQRDSIPQARGLGSSSACIVSGLAAANAISGTKLSKDELARMAAVLEGHPDNTTPAILGGMIVGALSGSRLDYIKLESPLSQVAFAVIIPDFVLHTAHAREVLPNSYSREDAVFNISRAALTVAAFASGEFYKLRVAMNDRIHQPYRFPLAPGVEQLFNACVHAGAYGAFLSGAGPAVVAVIPPDIVTDFKKSIIDEVNSIPGGWKICILDADREGVIVQEA